MSQPLIEHPSADACYLYLVRHGATPPNLLDPPIMQGKGINEPLAEIGRAQAARLGEALAARPLKAVYTSPLLRAVETARAIASPHGLVVEPIDALVEVEVGDWEGLTWPEVESREPQAYRAFREDPAESGYPGGETLRELYDRVAPALEELMRRHVGQEVAVAAHSVVNRVYLGQLLGLSFSEGRSIAQTNCAINLLRWRDGRVRVLTVNALGHLL